MFKKVGKDPKAFAAHPFAEVNCVSVPHGVAFLHSSSLRAALLNLGEGGRVVGLLSATGPLSTWRNVKQWQGSIAPSLPLQGLTREPCVSGTKVPHSWLKTRRCFQEVILQREREVILQSREERLPRLCPSANDTQESP